VDDRIDDRAKVTGGENVGKRVDKRSERAIVARRMRKLGGAHLVWPPCDRNGADGGEIRLGSYRLSEPGTRFSGTLVVGEGRYDLR